MRAGLACLLIGCLLTPPLLAAEPPDPRLAKYLDDMLNLGENFDPVHLRGLGASGLRGAFDEVVPLSRLPWVVVAPAVVGAAQVEAWRAGLGDESYQVRAATTERLIAAGTTLRKLVEQFELDADPEVKLRARIVLDAWDRPLRVTEDDPVVDYGEGFQKYLRCLSDAQLAPILVERATNLLSYGLSDEDPRWAVIYETLRATARLGNEQHCATFTPFLQHRNPHLARVVAEGICEGRTPKYLPSLVVQALSSERDDIALSALGALVPCRNAPDSAEIRARLHKIRATRKHQLQEKALYVLLHEFDDEGARDFLIEQLQLVDGERSRWALKLLRDAAPPGQPGNQALLRGLEQFLIQPDHDLRATAAKALLKFTGEEVVRRALPLLADRKALIAHETGQALLRQPDQAMLKRVLTEAAENSSDPAIAKEARALLKKLP